MPEAFWIKLHDCPFEDHMQIYLIQGGTLALQHLAQRDSELGSWVSEQL
jgi:hypothetical protein